MKPHGLDGHSRTRDRLKHLQRQYHAEKSRPSSRPYAIWDTIDILDIQRALSGCVANPTYSPESSEMSSLTSSIDSASAAHGPTSHTGVDRRASTSTQAKANHTEALPTNPYQRQTSVPVQPASMPLFINAPLSMPARNQTRNTIFTSFPSPVTSETSSSPSGFVVARGGSIRPPNTRTTSHVAGPRVNFAPDIQNSEIPENDPSLFLSLNVHARGSPSQPRSQHLPSKSTNTPSKSTNTPSKSTSTPFHPPRSIRPEYAQPTNPYVASPLPAPQLDSPDLPEDTLRSGKVTRNPTMVRDIPADSRISSYSAALRALVTESGRQEDSNPQMRPPQRITTAQAHSYRDADAPPSKRNLSSQNRSHMLAAISENPSRPSSQRAESAPSASERALRPHSSKVQHAIAMATRRDARYALQMERNDAQSHGGKFRDAKSRNSVENDARYHDQEASSHPAPSTVADTPPDLAEPPPAATTTSTSTTFTTPSYPPTLPAAPTCVPAVLPLPFALALAHDGHRGLSPRRWVSLMRARAENAARAMPYTVRLALHGDGHDDGQNDGQGDGRGDGYVSGAADLKAQEDIVRERRMQARAARAELHAQRERERRQALLAPASDDGKHGGRDRKKHSHDKDFRPKSEKGASGSASNVHHNATQSLQRKPGPPHSPKRGHHQAAQVADAQALVTAVSRDLHWSHVARGLESAGKEYWMREEPKNPPSQLCRQHSQNCRRVLRRVRVRVPVGLRAWAASMNRADSSQHRRNAAKKEKHGDHDAEDTGSDFEDEDVEIEVDAPSEEESDEESSGRVSVRSAQGSEPEMEPSVDPASLWMDNDGGDECVVSEDEIISVRIGAQDGMGPQRHAERNDLSRRRFSELAAERARAGSVGHRLDVVLEEEEDGGMGAHGAARGVRQGGDVEFEWPSDNLGVGLGAVDYIGFHHDDSQGKMAVYGESAGQDSWRSDMPSWVREEMGDFHIGIPSPKNPLFSGESVGESEFSDEPQYPSAVASDPFENAHQMDAPAAAAADTSIQVDDEEIEKGFITVGKRNHKFDKDMAVVPIPRKREDSVTGADLDTHDLSRERLTRNGDIILRATNMWTIEGHRALGAYEPRKLSKRVFASAKQVNMVPATTLSSFNLGITKEEILESFRTGKSEIPDFIAISEDAPEFIHVPVHAIDPTARRKINTTKGVDKEILAASHAMQWKEGIEDAYEDD